MKFDKIILGILVLLTLVEILSFFNSYSGRLGVILWIILWLIMAIFACKSGKYIVDQFRKHRSWITGLAMIMWLVLIFTYVSDIQNIDGEHTQLISCTLDHLSSDSWGFRETCMFGFPARENIVPALPSLFGRSVFLLNIGIGLTMIIALLIFSAGALKQFKDKRLGDITVAILLVSILHLGHFTRFFFNFQHGMYPFLFTLIGLGLFLNYQKEHDNDSLVLIGCTLIFLVHSYTPSLASVVLGIIWLIYSYFLFRNRTMLFVLLIVIISLLASFTYRGDVHLLTSNDGSKISDLAKATEHLFFNTLAIPVMTPFISLVVILTIIIGLANKKLMIPSMWVIFVFVASIICRGYTSTPIDLRLHRMTLAFPVIFAMVIYLIIDLKPDKRLLYLLFVILAISGLCYNTVYYLQTDRYNYNDNNQMNSFAINWMKNFIPDDASLYIDSPLLYSLYDQTRYFMPGSKIIILGNECTVSEKSNHAFLLTQQEHCHYNDTFIDTFYYRGNPPLSLYKIEDFDTVIVHE